MDFGDATDALVDSDTYIEDVCGGSGLHGPPRRGQPRGRVTGTDIPNELSGLAVIALAAADGGDYAGPVMAGAGAYTFNAVARRVGIRSTVVNAVGVVPAAGRRRLRHGGGRR
jgi:hypothetical protein